MLALANKRNSIKVDRIKKSPAMQGKRAKGSQSLISSAWPARQTGRALICATRLVCGDGVCQDSVMVNGPTVNRRLSTCDISARSVVILPKNAI